MKLKFAFLNLFLGCISLLIINTKFISNAKGEELLKVELHNEIKKGKFLIGLKQYLGGENDSFSEKKNINFTTNKGFLNLISSNGIKHNSTEINIAWADIPVKNPKTIERIVFGPFASYESAKKQSEKLRDKGFLNLISSNGIKHKSKQINISWVDIPNKNPKTIDRIVFGPFASYESAKKQAEKLKDKGFKTTVAYPKNWEVWIPFEDDLPEFELKNKISRKIKNFQITPVLRSEYSLMKLEGPIYIYAQEDIKINLSLIHI